MSGVVRIRRATKRDAPIVGALVFELLEELAAPNPSGYTPAATMRTARRLFQRGTGVWAFVAFAGGAPAGVLTLNEGAALYARGRFGEISELYVRPAFRGAAVGGQLLDAAIRFARARRWMRLEVTAAPPPRWQRTVSFYERAGFVHTGPHFKMELGRR